MHKRSWIFVVGAAAWWRASLCAVPDHGRGRRQGDPKYQTASCQQLWQEKAQGQGKPKPEMEQRAIKALQSDPQMRQAFFNKVSAPIVNKMFECGMIP
jgi:hypothetical protein